MEKLAIGALLGLLLGGGGAAVAMGMSGDDTEEAPIQLADADADQSDEDDRDQGIEEQKPAPASSSDVPDDFGERLAAQRREWESAHASEIERLNGLLASERELRSKLQTRADNLEAQLESLGQSADPFADMTPVERKKHAIDTLASLQDLVKIEEDQEFDVKSILQHMETLKRLGADGFARFVEAYELVAPDRRRGSDERRPDLTPGEFDALFSDEFIRLALTNSTGDVPARIQQGAAWRIMNRRDIDESEKAQLLGNALLTSEDQSTRDFAVRQLSRVDDPSTVEPLVQALQQTELSRWSRQQAFEGLAENSSPEAEAALQRIAADTTNEELSREAQRALDERESERVIEEIKENVIVEGYLIERVFPNSAAATAGIKVGDIITRYNGRQITREFGINNAKNTAQTGTQVAVDVYRGGSYLTFYIAAGTIGIDGGHVSP